MMKIRFVCEITVETVAHVADKHFFSALAATQWFITRRGKRLHRTLSLIALKIRCYAFLIPNGNPVVIAIAKIACKLY